MDCPECRAEIESLSWRFCDRCGEPLCLLEVDRDSLRLTADPADAQTFQAKNAGGGLLSVLITTNRDWLTAGPQRVLLGPSEAQVVSVSVRPEAFAPGMRPTGKIVISAGDPDAEPTVCSLDVGLEV